MDKPGKFLASSIVRVLQVDDENNNWSPLEKLLNEIDPTIQINHITNPDDVLNLIEKETFNCIVTDYKLNGMNGLQLASKIREKSKIPIILYTGKSEELIAERAFLIGIDDYIRKEDNPSHYQLLIKRIKNVVDKKNIEDLYLKVVEEARDGIAIIVNSKVAYANKAMSDILGYEYPEEFIGKKIIEDFVTKPNQSIYEKRIKDRLSGSLPPLMEYYAKKKNGEEIILETLTTKIVYNGQIGLLTFCRDITERKRIEQNLTKSEERFRSLVTMAPDGIITMDIKGKITYVNPSFLKLTGFEENEILGQSILKLQTLRIKDIPSYTKLFTKLIFGSGSLDSPIEFVFKKKDGTEGIGEGRAQAVSPGGSGKEVLMIARDITERKKLEEDLKLYSKELEKLAEERSRKLIESEKLIVTGSIASSLGHDLRGPLNTIRSAVYLMQMRPDKTEEMLKMIDASVDRSILLLDELRDKTKDFALEFEDVEITQLLHEVISETLVPPEITLQTNFNSVALVHIDRGKMKRVFENLIRNAYEAMPGGGKLSISVSEKKDKITIAITDQGVGIPESVLNNLFKPFVTTKEHGTGLGLSFCKRTVDAHGGEIKVSSKVNKGSTFSVVLQKVKEEETLYQVISKNK